ncbi:hypothetical protein [Streptomyces sp. NPDC007264]|uniref:hypothetical protein n=1 Tax=Streptomyces sp. NPDC007264 TaxID=3364777 RepID=UPI0036DEBAF8
MDTNTASEAGTWEPPRLTIVVYANGRASVGGIPVVVPDGGDLADVRAAAMRTAVDMAVRQDRPVHALALEPDGTTWPLVIHPDGRVEEDTGVGPGDPGPAADGTGESGRPAEPTPPAAPRNPRNPRTETLVLTVEVQEPVETPPPPEQLRERLARIAEAGEGGRLEAAITLAADLEREAALLYGATHPHVLHARAVRAHVSTLARDWARAADLYLGIATAWRRMSDDRGPQVRRNAANAHHCWCQVTDAAESERIGEAVVRMWLDVRGAERESAAARRRCNALRHRLSLGI